MKATTEIEIKVSNAKVTNATVMPDGTCKLTFEMVNPVSNVTEKDNIFVRVEASKLSLNDKFMQHRPRTDQERNFKMLLEKAIKSGLKDFKRPKYDPACNKNGIYYDSIRTPAVGESYNWWNQAAKDFKPERNSRLGTRTEYIAFLGVLIKKLVENGWFVEKAWDAVCNDSKELGHYWNSKDTDHNLEPTGFRKICEFYDLANCYKILATDEGNGGFWLAGGNYDNYSTCEPLANFRHFRSQNYFLYCSVGWLVLD